jgi:F0F1-type ATP synthase membrane subunit b/b'
MDRNTLKSLRKEDLLKMLQDQETEIAELKNELQQMKNKLEDAQYFIMNPEGLAYIKLRDEGEGMTGSIADSAMGVSRVFDEAQKSADKYLSEIKEMHDFISGVRQRSEDAAKLRADEIVKRAEDQLASYEEKKHAVVSETWADIKSRLENYYQAHKDIQSLLGDKVDISLKDIQKGFEQ